MNKKPWLYLLVLSLVVSLLACQSVSEPEPEPEVEPEIELTEEQRWAQIVAEREALEVTRKQERQEFYVPLPALDSTKEKIPVSVKALFLTANVAGMEFSLEDVSYYADYVRALSQKQSFDASGLDSVNRLERALGIALATEINAFVIDMKDDRGLIPYPSQLEIVQMLGTNFNTPLNNLDSLMAFFDAHDIYSIARVVAFKDPFVAEKLPNHSIQLIAGGVYRDKAGFAWVNPFDPYIWDYLVAVSQEVALLGFDEIQYDYVRFPDSAKAYNPIAYFPYRDNKDKDVAISEFLAYAKKHLEAYPVFVSADVFGVITNSWDDKPEDIGQTWRHIANVVDYISPMIYPSHYGPGYYGFSVPDQHPYAVVKKATQEALERNAAQRRPAIIRSWFQGFSAPWVQGNITYTPDVIAQQMIAHRELGLDEYILWNAANIYDPMTFFYEDQLKPALEVGSIDILERTPQMALERYLIADRSQRHSILYLLTPMDMRADDFDEFSAMLTQQGRLLIQFQVLSVAEVSAGVYEARVSVLYETETQKASSSDALYRIALENRVFKIAEPPLDWVDK